LPINRRTTMNQWLLTTKRIWKQECCTISCSLVPSSGLLPQQHLRHRQEVSAAEGLSDRDVQR
jgi:hypothetical protein